MGNGKLKIGEIGVNAEFNRFDQGLLSQIPHFFLASGATANYNLPREICGQTHYLCGAPAVRNKRSANNDLD